MEMLSMCRICLVESVRMFNLDNLNTSLMETYEKLTEMQFETKDSRPSQVCYICYAHLQTCHKLRVNSLHSEQLFTQILDSNGLGSTSFHNIPTVLTIHHITNFSVVPEPPCVSDTDVNIYDVDVKVEPLGIKDDVQMKLEDVEGDTNPLVVIKMEENHPNIYPNKDDTEPIFMESKNMITKFNTTNEATTEDSSDKSNDCRHMITTDDKCRAKCFSLQDDLNIHKGLYAGDISCYDNNNSCSDYVDLINHVRARFTKKCHKCDTCKKCFGRNSYLWRRLFARNREKLYKCHICAKTYTELNLLKTHMCLHAGEKLFKCVVCEKRFTLKGNLRRHYSIHTDISFKCDVCNKSFNRKSYLSDHLRTHTGEKPFKCHLCNKRYTNKSHLNCHIRVHTGDKPYKCDFCDKHFRSNAHLKSHIRIHTGEKPYKCHSCDKCFNYPSHLSIHVRTHTGEKPYQCHICTKSFNIRGHLNVHIRKHVEITTL